MQRPSVRVDWEGAFFGGPAFRAVRLNAAIRPMCPPCAPPPPPRLTRRYSCFEALSKEASMDHQFSAGRPKPLWLLLAALSMLVAVAGMATAAQISNAPSAASSRPSITAAAAFDV